MTAEADRRSARLREAARRHGVSWPERIAWARTQLPMHPPPPDAALDDWRAAVGQDGLDIRLTRDRLTVDQAHAAVSDRPGPFAADTDWLPWFENLREWCTRAGADGAGDDEQWLAGVESGIPARAQAIPFAPVWWPGVVRAGEHLAAAHPELVARVAPSAMDDLRISLLARLSEVSASTLLAGLDADLTLGQRLLKQIESPVHPPGRGRFARFCRSLAAGAVDDVLIEHPVLPSLLGTVVRQWQVATVEMLTRVDRHRRDLAEVFGIDGTADLTRAMVGAGDQHQDGRGVVVLAFDDHRVVYKPRDVRLERLWSDLVALIGPHLRTSALRAPTVLAADDGTPYGFTEFIPHRAATSPEALRSFYRNAGATLALLHAVSATDCHHENLVACDDQLVLIDGEALFETRGTRMQPTDPGAVTGLATVLQVGMLPSWLWLEGDRTALDISALGTSPETTIRPNARGWRAANTDAMAHGQITPVPPHPTSLPTPAGTSPDLTAHLADLVDGFTDGYRGIVAARAAGLLDLLRGAGDLRRRLIQRPTYVYAILLAHSRDPQALRSAADRGMVLERLTRAYLGGSTDPWELLVAEQEALARLDVPLFESSLRGDLTTWRGGSVADWPGTDALGDVCARIADMDDVDLAWQVRLIRSAVAARSFTPPSTDVDVAPVPQESADAVPAMRDRIRGRIVGDALHSDTHATWMTLALLPDGARANVQRIGSGLYDGVLGVATYLLHDADTALAHAALRPLLDQFDPDELARTRAQLLSVSLGWSGTGGYLRALRHLGSRRHLAVDDVTPRISAIIRALTPDMIRKDRWLDLVNGAAGLVGPLAAEVTTGLLPPEDLDRAAALLSVAVDHLMAHQLEGGGWTTLPASAPLTGLAHGASGIAVALAQAHAALGVRGHLDAALRGLAYEDGTFDPKARNWPDFRTGARGRFMLGWCAGAPGIALARQRLLDLLPDHPQASRWQHDLEAAATTTAGAPLLQRDHLCCGNLGRVAVLRHLGARQGRPDWTAAGDRLLSDVLARAGQGLPRSFVGANDAGILAVPGFMTGLSGGGLLLAADGTGWVDDLLL